MEKRVLERIRLQSEHLRMTQKDRGEPQSKIKIELLEMYAMQMEGRMSIDNKQINEISTSASEDLTTAEYQSDSELERLHELEALESQEAQATSQQHANKHAKQKPFQHNEFGKRTTEWTKRKTVEDEICEVMAQGGDDQVILKYTMPSSSSAVPGDRLLGAS